MRQLLVFALMLVHWASVSEAQVQSSSGIGSAPDEQLLASKFASWFYRATPGTSADLASRAPTAAEAERAVSAVSAVAWSPL